MPTDTLAETETKYLRFRDVTAMFGKGAKARRTRVVAVESKASGELLGTIHWWGAWRQYVLAPSPATVWNPGCMADVTAKIEELMAERRMRQS